MRLALAQFGVARPAGLDDFLDRIAGTAHAARNGGAELLVLPEYAAMVLAGAFIAYPDIAAELHVVVDHAGALLAGLQAVARESGLWLLGGTVPMRDPDGQIRNRAPFISPAGICLFQDKQMMTRFEAEKWGVAGGLPPNVFATPFGLIGVSICYDSEFPLHVRAQVNAGAALILVPSCTDSLAGFNRVRLSARARAIENQCFIAMSPLVGAAPWSGAIDENRGYAGVYGPADIGFPQNGVMARGNLDDPGLIFADIDTARIAEVRVNGGVLNNRDWPALPFIPPCPVLAFA
jgi:predicted amidohydrolase